jgi:hypothetical protein
MSYSANFTVTKGTDDDVDMFDDRVELLTEQVRGGQPDAVDAAGEHFDRIRRALVELVAAVGPEDGTLSVTVSGHANPGHAPTEGWANESITVAVSHTS